MDKSFKEPAIKVGDLVYVIPAQVDGEIYYGVGMVMSKNLIKNYSCWYEVLIYRTGKTHSVGIRGIQWGRALTKFDALQIDQFLKQDKGKPPFYRNNE